MKKIARSVVKYVDIAASPEQVYTFLADPMNWPQYAVVNLRSVNPGKDGWFNVVTKFGQGEIKIIPVQELGVLDHIWKDPQASWTVFARVVPNGEGATFMMTFFQPPILSDEQFDQAMREMDIEMGQLREILEP